MSTWAFAIPFAMCLIGIIGGIALHFYAEWSGKREEEREERFWREHQNVLTDEVARRRAMRARAELRHATRPYSNQGTAV